MNIIAIMNLQFPLFRRNHMDKKIFKGQWSRVKGMVQEHWDYFTDNEVDLINGDWNDLVRKLQEKYGYSESDAEEEIEYFMAEMGDEEDYEDYMNEDEPMEDVSTEDPYQKFTPGFL